MNKKYLGIHREGWKFFIIFIIISFFSFFLTKLIFLISFFLSLFTLWFFRDPERYSDSQDNQVLSAADGKICFIGEDTAPIETNINQKMNKVSIFMNVFNVHVNRSPVDGNIETIIYKNGKFFNASLDKASEHNERNSIIINNNNEKIIVVQIAGLIARRIITEVDKDQELEQGKRIGMIRFGSRVDVYFENYTPLVKVNQKTIAGETLLAKK